MKKKELLSLILKKNHEYLQILIDGSCQKEQIDDFPDEIKRLIIFLDKNDYLLRNSDLQFEALFKDTFEEKNIIFLESILPKTSLQQSIKKIKNSKICIIGVGGVGGNVLLSLVQMGFNDFVIVDNDTVEISNLNRQVLLEGEDIGKKKIEAIDKNLRKRFPSVVVSAYDLKIESDLDVSNLIKMCSPSLIVQSADTPSYINNIVVPTCLKRGIPCLTGGVGYSAGYFKLFNTNDVFIPTEGNHLKSLKGSLSPTNMLISSYMALEIFKYILGIRYESIENPVVVNFL